MKEFKYILKLMADKDPFMYVIIILTSIINGLLPFIWIFAPAYVIENRSNNIEFFIPFFIGLAIVTSAMKFINSFLAGNYRMRMNNLRYSLNTKIIDYSLKLSYPDQEDKKQKELITNAIVSVGSPYEGFGNIVLKMPTDFGLLISIVGYLWIFTRLDWWLVIYLIIMTVISARFVYQTVGVFDKFWENISDKWEQIKQLNYELQSPVSKLDILMYNFNKLFSKYYSSVTLHWDNELAEVNKKVFDLNLKSKIISLIRDIPIFTG